MQSPMTPCAVSRLAVETNEERTPAPLAAPRLRRKRTVVFESAASAAITRFLAASSVLQAVAIASSSAAQSSTGLTATLSSSKMRVGKPNVFLMTMTMTMTMMMMMMMMMVDDDGFI